MSREKIANYFVDIIIMLLFILISLNGLLLQIIFHIKKNSNDFIYMYFNKTEWLLIHKVLSIAITIGVIIHIAMHSVWLKNTLKGMSFLKSDYKNKPLFYLFVTFFISAILGFISWILSIGGHEFRHEFIELHDKISIVLIILFIVHFIKKIRWLFNTTGEMIFLKNKDFVK